MARDRTDEAAAELHLNRSLAALLGCVFVVMIGYGIALTVLPVYTERIHGLAGASNRLVAFHVGVLTSVYALAQLVAGPAVGRLGDRCSPSASAARCWRGRKRRPTRWRHSRCWCSASLMARAGAASGTAEPLVAAAAVEHVAP